MLFSFFRKTNAFVKSKKIKQILIIVLGHNFEKYIFKKFQQESDREESLVVEVNESLGLNSWTRVGCMY